LRSFYQDKASPENVRLRRTIGEVSNGNETRKDAEKRRKMKEKEREAKENAEVVKGT